MPGDARTLSSDQTFGAKFVVPLVVILVFDVAAIALWWDPNEWPMMGALHASSDPIRWVFAVVGIVLTVGSLWFGAPLKMVRLDDEALYLSNFRREIRVPLTELESVGGSHWSISQVVTLGFRSETAFGRRILFMPKLRWLSFGEPPVVGELQRMIGVSADQKQSGHGASSPGTASTPAPRKATEPAPAPDVVQRGQVSHVEARDEQPAALPVPGEVLRGTADKSP
jgi:hypothetical protein